MSSLTTVGLVYDIFGVGILVVALMAPPIGDLYKQAGAYYVGNKALFKVLLLQRIDAQFGLPILLAGFALQLAGMLGLDVPPAWLWLIILTLVAALVSYGIVRPLRSRRSDRLFDRLRKKARKEEEKSASSG